MDCPRVDVVNRKGVDRRHQEAFNRKDGKDDTIMALLISISSNKTVNETTAALEIAVQANHFGIMQIHNLKESMTKKGVEFERECLIFEICQPQQAKKVLDQNMSISTALPCRITVYEEGGKTILATLKPTALLALFNVPKLEEVAMEIENTLIKIMKEAAH